MGDGRDEATTANHRFSQTAQALARCLDQIKVLHVVSARLFPLKSAD